MRYIKTLEDHQFDHTEEYAVDPNLEVYRKHKLFWKIGDMVIISFSNGYSGIYELKTMHHEVTDNCVFDGYILTPRERYGCKDLVDHYNYRTMCDKFIGRDAGNVDYPTDEELAQFYRFRKQDQFDL